MPPRDPVHASVGGMNVDPQRAFRHALTLLISKNVGLLWTLSSILSTYDHLVLST